MNPKDHALLALVEHGACVWEKQHAEADYGPRGGRVYAIDSVPVLDENGEKTGEAERAFDVVQWSGGYWHFRRIGASQIDTTKLEPLNSAFVRGDIRRIALTLSRGKGSFMPDELRLIDVMHRFAGVIAGRR